MFDVSLTFGDGDGEAISFASMPFSLPAENLMRLLQAFKKEAGAYLDKGTAANLDTMLATSVHLPAKAKTKRVSKKSTSVQVF